MHTLLAAYSLAGGDARKLGEVLDVPTAIASAWLRGSKEDVPETYLARIEAAAAQEIDRGIAELRKEAAGDADPFRKRVWRDRLRDLDRAHWLVFGISLFEFQLRFFLKLATTEGSENVSH